VRWRKASIAVITLLLAIGALAGCVESDPESAQTPTGATTVQNSAAQTDSEGNTVAAPAGGGGGEEAPAAGGGGEDDNAGEGEGGGGATGDAEAGVALFTSVGCGGCHTFEAAGAAAAVGPNLDEVLAGKSPEDIRTDITDPDTEITEGFPPGVMPGNYETSLSPEDLDNLVAALTR